MLNVTQRISLSKKSKRLIRKLIKKENGLKSTSWNNIEKSVKHEISKKLLEKHGPRCIYCERYFLAEKNEIDHLAHKGNYYQYTFITTNLFYACNYCNSMIKNQRNTIVGLPNKNYKLNKFYIVHPYFNNPSNELKYQDGDRIYFDWVNCSDLGKSTIKFWGWDGFIYTNLRAKIILQERLNPLTSEEEKLLIQEIIAYK
jgi:uncharacterized protein (TIGR02646 family)